MPISLVQDFFSSSIVRQNKRAMDVHERNGTRVCRFGWQGCPWRKNRGTVHEYGHGEHVPSGVRGIRLAVYYHADLGSHHHIESVHFVTSKGEALHGAVAVVQTPGREYYVLRDNGMQVGCEEEGVPEVWQGILGCDTLGRVRQACMIKPS